MTSEREYPYAPAAFINAIAEDGTKQEAIEWLQKTWNKLCWVRKQSARQDWQDISTAPKDGTYIDIWVVPHSGVRHRAANVFWIDSAQCFRDEHNDFRYHPPKKGEKCWKQEQCTTRSGWGREGNINFIQVTHWMIPPAPQDRG